MTLLVLEEQSDGEQQSRSSDHTPATVNNEIRERIREDHLDRNGWVSADRRVFVC